MNTKIYYLYRDADNYKVHNECVVSGVITEAQQAAILACLDDGEYFIPSKVGLPERRFDTFNPDVDHPWFELDSDSFEETSESPTVEVSADQLVEAFTSWKGRWERTTPNSKSESYEVDFECSEKLKEIYGLAVEVLDLAPDESECASDLNDVFSDIANFKNSFEQVANKLAVQLPPSLITSLDSQIQTAECRAAAQQQVCSISVKESAR